MLYPLKSSYTSTVLELYIQSEIYTISPYADDSIFSVK